MAAAIKKPASPAVPSEAPSIPQIETTVAAVSTPVAEMQENIRQAVEKTVAETRAAYAKAKAAAEEATGALETSYSSAANGIVAFNAKALEALRANTEANFDFMKSVINVKSLAEFVSLQSEHARSRADAMNAQAKDIAALVQKVATESVEPIKSQVVKTFKLAV